MFCMYKLPSRQAPIRVNVHRHKIALLSHGFFYLNLSFLWILLFKVIFLTYIFHQILHGIYFVLLGKQRFYNSSVFSTILLPLFFFFFLFFFKQFFVQGCIHVYWLMGLTLPNEQPLNFWRSSRLQQRQEMSPIKRF